MGPLVPDIIGNELNFIVAILIGIAFGFILEQAGFSTSKKLVGLFYGYDFTVLRVFFTAGVTAMLGVVAFSHFGILDVNLIYINPLFLWSALVGGFIMGLGFVIGGFCPGTSVAAAAIGKVDAMWFLLGSVIGVYLFAEGYPIFEGLYKATDMGSPQAFDSLGISQGLFAFLLTFVAIFAFWAVSYIESKNNNRKIPTLAQLKPYILFSVIGIVLGFSALFLPSKQDYLLAKIQDKEFIANYDIEVMPTDELAFLLMDEDTRLRIFDCRPKNQFEKFALPNAMNITHKMLFEKEMHKFLSLSDKINVFVCRTSAEARKTAILAKELGYDNVKVLDGGMKQFRKDYIDYKLPENFKGTRLSDKIRFKVETAAALPSLIKKAKEKAAGNTQKKAKRVIGGC